MKSSIRKFEPQLLRNTRFILLIFCDFILRVLPDFSLYLFYIYIILSSISKHRLKTKEQFHCLINHGLFLIFYLRANENVNQQAYG